MARAATIDLLDGTAVWGQKCSSAPVQAHVCHQFSMQRSNIYSFQEILSYSTLDMAKQYLKLAEQDLVDTH